VPSTPIAPTDETFARAERGEVVLGGCMVSDDFDPEWACSNCHSPYVGAESGFTR
jgi:hypothetical protein